MKPCKANVPLFLPVFGLILLLVTAFGVACGEDEDETPAENPSYSLGYAEADITPYPEFETVLMGAYGIPGIHRAMVGVHDPLLAQAALITNGKGQAFLVIALDLVGYQFEFGEAGPGIREVRESIVEALKDTLTLSPEMIVLASSHNHTSTDLIGTAQDIGKMPSEEFLQWHVDKITKVAVEAAKALAPVDLYLGETTLEGYSGRDEEPAGSGERCSQIIDNTIGILQAKDKSGAVKLTLINYAKHPTQIDWLLKEASADYIYGFRKEMEAQTGGKAMFLQGFEAAVHDGPLYADVPGEMDSYEKAENFGKILATKVIEGAQTLKKNEDFSIEHKESILSIPTKGFYNDLKAIAKLILRSFETGENGKYVIKYTPVSWHKLGDAQFVIWPGEASPEYSVALRARMTDSVPFMVGLGNDEICYIVDPESVENDPTGKLARYEALMGPGPGAGEIIMDVMEDFGFLEAKE